MKANEDWQRTDEARSAERTAARHRHPSAVRPRLRLLPPWNGATATPEHPDSTFHSGHQSDRQPPHLRLIRSHAPLRLVAPSNDPTLDPTFDAAG